MNFNKQEIGGNVSFLCAILRLPWDIYLTFYVRLFNLSVRNNPPGSASFAATAVIVVGQFMLAIALWQDFIGSVSDILGGKSRSEMTIILIPILIAALVFEFLDFEWPSRQLCASHCVHAGLETKSSERPCRRRGSVRDCFLFLVGTADSTKWHIRKLVGQPRK